MSDVCGLTCEYRGALKMLTAVMYLFEKLHIAHCGKEREEMAAAAALFTVRSSAGH